MNILLIDGGQHFGHSAGRLNHTLHQTARDTLTALGHAVKETVIEEGYDKDAEVEKWLWMDAVVWQMPGWWMGASHYTQVPACFNSSSAHETMRDFHELGTG